MKIRLTDKQVAALGESLVIAREHLDLNRTFARGAGNHAAVAGCDERIAVIDQMLDDAAFVTRVTVRVDYTL